MSTLYSSSISRTVNKSWRKVFSEAPRIPSPLHDPKSDLRAKASPKTTSAVMPSILLISHQLQPQKLIQPVRIESNHNLFVRSWANHERGCGAALVFLRQILHRGRVMADIPLFEYDPSLREECRNKLAGWSARLREHHDFWLARLIVFHAKLDALYPANGAEIYSYSIANVMAAVFSSMAETEQYLSFESFTASSIAFLVTLPRTL